MFRHALLLVYLVGSAVSTHVFYGGAYHHPVYYYQSPAASYFRTPYYPFVPTPTYYQPHPLQRVTVTPGSDVVAKPVIRNNYLQNDVSNDATVVEAAPAAPAAPVNPKNIIDASQITPGLIFRTSAPPVVVSQGMHLGDSYPSQEGYSQGGFADDAPPSTLTQGPHPGSYTAVSSDEDSESTLFQSQDGSGNILFGYSSPQQARLEARSLDGSVRGSYSYVDPEGKTVKVRYSAGRDGFQVFDEDEAYSVIPKQVKDTPEVEAAKSLFARLFLQAKLLAEQADQPAEPEKIEEPVKPVQPEVHQDEEKPPQDNEQYDNDEKIHPPDSIYTVSEGLKGVEEDLEYYGAAKGTVPLTYASHFHTYGMPLSEQQHLRRAIAAASAPQLSAYSAPTLREQQHLHRAGKSLDQKQARNPIPEGYFPSFGGQTVPVFVGVAPESEPIANTRSAALPLPEKPVEKKEQQAIPPASISQKANFFGAVPVAAVHDTQVSPNQRVEDHQTKPVYIESN